MKTAYIGNPFIFGRKLDVMFGSVIINPIHFKTARNNKSVVLQTSFSCKINCLRLISFQLRGSLTHFFRYPGAEYTAQNMQ
jgi:hypothetical protein